jgi:EAL domain-containing protein (putative c-di-GMP-specific phosphodiesterase class I)
VIDATVTQLGEWAEQGIELRASVNVSIRDLHTTEMAEFLAHRLLYHRVSADRIQLEITEGALMSDPSRVADTLRFLAELGVVLSLDDFGTGYSSLAHLRRLPVSEVKIDRGFTKRMSVDEDDATIVRSIIELAGALGLRVVAEGVEDEPTWRQLAALGCDEAQGWYFSPPRAAEDLTRWLRRTPRFPLLASVHDRAAGS